MKKLCRVGLVICLLCDLLIPVKAAGGFSDVPEGIWYESVVTALSQQGVVSGYPDGTFRPQSSVTYGEALKLIFRAVGCGELAPTGTHWASGYRDLAVSCAYMTAEETEDLDAPIHRSAVAKLSAGALGIWSYRDNTPFADCSDPEVLGLFDAGILTGVETGGVLYFYGDQPLTRAELCTIVWRIDKYLSSMGGHMGTPETPPPEAEIPPAAEPDVPAAAPTEPDMPAVTPTEPDISPDIPQEAPFAPNEDQPPVVEPPKTITYKEDTYVVLEDVPVFAYDPKSFYLENGRMACTDENVRLIHGIDVSAHQGEIDWDLVRSDGVEFAILRAAYRGYTVGNLNVDSFFENNIQNALRTGLDVGVYVFSQAITVEEALEEADLLIQLLAPYEITGPVVFDWEVIGSKNARTYGLDTQILCDAANAFCSRIEEAGYRPMIYFNSYCGYAKYDLSQVMDHDFWFAQYREQPDFYYNYQMWQYSDKGRVAGIQGNVDMNVLFAPQ